MTIYDSMAILLTATALIAWANRRLLHLHPTIGVMVGSLTVSGILIGLSVMGVPVARGALEMLDKLDFGHLLLEFLLGFLLFAGALHVDLDRLLYRKWEIGTFALVGVAGSAFAVAGLIWAICQVLGIAMGFVPCLLFGALISPTDPIAVLSILQTVGAPKDLETDVCGESLFNDGIGVVMFMTVLTIYTGGAAGAGQVAQDFLIAAAGGFALGVVLGHAGRWMIGHNEDLLLLIMLTVAVASGGFALANALGCSGAIAIVVAGVMIGNRIAQHRVHHGVVLNAFWEMVDQYGNAILFVLVGLEVLVVTRAVYLSDVDALVLAGLAIPAVLVSRSAAILSSLELLSLKFRFTHRAGRILVWGGLRGGLPFAMALSLPNVTPEQILARDYILTMTYAVVAFSIIVQGLTVKGMVRRAIATAPDDSTRGSII
jgi:monovalent cation:H+ antiporter, CPA1 family